MTLATPSSPAGIEIRSAAPVRQVVLENVSWSLYEQMVEQVGDRPIRLTYDDGRLEIMSPSGLHERIKQIVARLVWAYCEAIGVESESLGSTTFKREELLKGLEPDDCYYIANAAAVRGKSEFDWDRDPPPDLAIEIDISPHDVARQPVYAALRVPEVWRYDGKHLRFLRLRPDGSGYDMVERSISFPQLTSELLTQWIAMGIRENQGAAVRAMRDWLKQQKK
jgi:Uma2 family endonuclease